VTRSGGVAAIAAAVALAGTWLAWRGDAASEASPDPLDGSAVFTAKGCAVCHDAPGTTARLSGFPSLVGALEWAGDRNPDLSADDYVRQSVLSPGEYISPAFTAGVGPTDAMPRLRVSPAELDALVDFVLQRSGPGD
jgi:mono/diheme cytochrome c family protein